MTKKRRSIPSIYKEEVIDINVSNIIREANNYAGAVWEFQDNIEEKAMALLKKLDFNDYPYHFVTNVYWCGILTAEPFDRNLIYRYTEAEILNLFKDYHLRPVVKEGDLVLEFHNPVKSPIYSFLNYHKIDGYGLNIPYSINGCFRKVAEYLESEISESDEFVNFLEWDDAM